MQKKLIVLLLLTLFMFTLCTQAGATQKPDPEKPCSITFSLEFDKKPLDGGKLNLYRVGQLSTDGDQFVPIDSLSQDVQSFQNIEDPEFAKTLNDLAQKHELTPHTASITNGQAVFSDLQTGVYVVSQLPGDEISGYAAINPFLVSLPQWQDGEYVYDLTAVPKVPLVPDANKPSEPPKPSEPTKPTEPNSTPDLPQTGQLNWPVPLMAVLGVALFGIGWGLCFSSKRRDV
ncbi:MAG: hypothetical protein IJ433_03725 [Ruminococcus sp.]|nr:hypothetical protein [Ruminococcus sp.]